MIAKLYIILSDGSEKLAASYSLYRDAILSGQDLAPRSFTIDTGSYIPSREEQLLVDDPPLGRVHRISKKIKTLTQQD